MKIEAIFGVALAVTIPTTQAVQARDQVHITGSSTVLPYASIVAEAFGENFEFPTPVVESGGSSAGLKRFCEGIGTNTIDIANASRKIKPMEIAACTANGVTDIIEVRIGYDGIVFASPIEGERFAFNPKDWYLALAARVPANGRLIDNPHRSWSDINKSLPDQKIIAFIPGTKHGTRETFEDKVMLAGCEDSGAFAMFRAEEADKKAAEKSCIKMRRDGVVVDIDGDYTETLASIESNEDGIGVFGLSFYENNADRLRVAPMSGVEPTVETISTGDYPVSRPLFFYVKKAHIGIIPGLKEYAEFFVSDEIAGPYGPLAEYGLVHDPELNKTQRSLSNDLPLAANS